MPNAYAIIKVIGYFINKNTRYCYIILRLCEIIGKYTSKNIVGVFIDLFRDYKIIGNIGYFIANNAELNNIYINIVLYILYLNILIKLYKGY